MGPVNSVRGCMKCWTEVGFTCELLRLEVPKSRPLFERMRSASEVLPRSMVFVLSCWVMCLVCLSELVNIVVERLQTDWPVVLTVVLLLVMITIGRTAVKSLLVIIPTLGAMLISIAGGYYALLFSLISLLLIRVWVFWVPVLVRRLWMTLTRVIETTGLTLLLSGLGRVSSRCCVLVISVLTKCLVTGVLIQICLTDT